MTTVNMMRSYMLKRAPNADFTHAVIGGGAVGLAIAARLAAREEGHTIVLERNAAVGMETSSRNSEVIHAGLYYPKDSLKTKLCIEGREMLYDMCERHSIPYKNCGKWIVAQTDQQFEELTKLHAHSLSLSIPTSFVSLPAASSLEPSVRALSGILSSPTTGILSSHAYMDHLLTTLLSSSGDLALHTTVTSLHPLPGAHTPGTAGWELTTVDAQTGLSSSITAENVINAAGLSACSVANLVLPPSRRLTQYFAKGNYFSYAGSRPRVSRLIYPVPEPGLAGLGTHLTLDIAGRMRFGPDVEWVSSASDLSVSAGRLPAAVREIKKYLPDIEEGRLAPDYAGVRPKLGPAGGKAFEDFVVRKEEGFEGLVNLLGIESPGLTSSLAIARLVEDLLYG